MKIVSYTALHYGSDYLGWAIRSIIDHVDQHVILYCPHGSHGSRTDRPCPDTRDELYAIAQAAAGDKLLWIDGDWLQENQQRESIYQYAPDADVILTLDSDEVWSPYWLEPFFATIEWGMARTYRFPFVHYWRSFWKAIIHDPAYPVRIVNVHGNGDMFWNPQEIIPFHTPIWSGINHFGYAQRPAVVEYKQYIHGHRSEWRRDIDWYRERFLANAQQDCHPVGSEFWSPEPVNPLDYLPEWMSQHPYFGKSVIE